ncbi:MAG: LysR family transcriptional regulator [Symbiopectobacterium sp.]
MYFWPCVTAATSPQQQLCFGFTPSSVTKAIQRLESRLKTSLFTRSTRQQTITIEGVIYRDA